MAVAGVTKIETRADYGTSGPAAVATSGRRESGGPQFNSGRSAPLPYRGRFTVTGTTYDSVGAVLGSCTVLLLDRYKFVTAELNIEGAQGAVVASAVSSGSGVFTFTVADNSTERWAVAMNTGVAGATIGPLTYVAAP